MRERVQGLPIQLARPSPHENKPVIIARADRATAPPYAAHLSARVCRPRTRRIDPCARARSAARTTAPRARLQNRSHPHARSARVHRAKLDCGACPHRLRGSHAVRVARAERLARANGPALQLVRGEWHGTSDNFYLSPALRPNKGFAKVCERQLWSKSEHACSGVLPNPATPSCRFSP